MLLLPVALVPCRYWTEGQPTALIKHHWCMSASAQALAGTCLLVDRL